MVVTNKTELTKEEMLSSLVVQTKKAQNSKFLLSGILFVCGVILTISSLINPNNSYISIGITLIIFSLFYIGFAIINIIKAPKNLEKQNADILDNPMSYEYTFKEQSFQVNIHAANKNSKLPYKYSNIKKIYEYENRFEFKLDDNLLLFIHKSGFAQEKGLDFFKKNILLNKKKIINKIKD